MDRALTRGAGNSPRSHGGCQGLSASELPSLRSSVQVTQLNPALADTNSRAPRQRVLPWPAESQHPLLVQPEPGSHHWYWQHTGSSEVINNDSIYLTPTQTPAHSSRLTHVSQAHCSQRSQPASADPHRVTSGSERTERVKWDAKKHTRLSAKKHKHSHVFVSSRALPGHCQSVCTVQNTWLCSMDEWFQWLWQADLCLMKPSLSAREAAQIVNVITLNDSFFFCFSTPYLTKLSQSGVKAVSTDRWWRETVSNYVKKCHEYR